MGQINLVEETLAAIRRKKKLYIKELECMHTIDERNEIKKVIDLLSVEEEKILRGFDDF